MPPSPLIGLKPNANALRDDANDGALQTGPLQKSKCLSSAINSKNRRYRGADKDGGTLEYIFDTDKQDVPKTVSKEKAAEIAADFYDDLLPRSDRRTGNAGISDNARCVLALFLLRHDQRTDATNVFRRTAAGWDGRRAKSGETAVDIIATSRKSGLSLTREPARRLSEIFDPKVLVPNDHRVPRINYRYVQRTVVFTLKQNLCPILRNLADSGTLLKWRAIAFRDCYRHRRAVSETDQEFRSSQLETLNDTIFNSMGQSKIHGHNQSPIPFAGRYSFWIASFSAINSPRTVLP
jgi:hypothetical protein